MSVTPEIRDELLVLVKAAQAYLELEQERGTAGLALVPRSAEPAVPAADPISRVAPGAILPPRESRIVPDAEAMRPSVVSNPPPSAAGTPPAAAGRSVPPPQAAAGEARLHRLEMLAQAASSCTACVLHEKRKRSVFARGSASAELAFVGEGPGRDEDQQGLPFVGAAGQLLDRMIAAMGYARDDVYICNVVKCRPPENRTPSPEEALACSQYLIPQLETVAPKLIVALGRCAAQSLGVAEAAGPWRGRFGAWRGIAVMPTYHPAFLLRSPEFKRTVWEDLQQVMGRLGRAR